MTTIRLGLVGAGNIAHAAHLPALAHLQAEGMVAVTVVDANPARRERAHAEFGFPVADDWRAVDLDALALCVPPGPNADIAVAAMSNGLHVLSEKPPGRTAAQARAMREAAAGQPDRVSMVGFNRRGNPLVRWARDHGDPIGPPVSFAGRFSRAAIGESPSNTASDWITADSCHMIDLAISVMGFPNRVGVSRRVVGSGPDNVWTLHLHTPNGSAILHLNYAAAQRVETAEWVGPGYEIRLELPGGADWRLMGAEPERLVLGPEVPFHEASGFLAQYRAFLAAITGDGPRPPCDFAYGARFMELVETILDAPSGSLREIDSDVITEVTPTTGRPAARASTAGHRPVVAIHHAIDAQPRFFSPHGMEQLSRYCDIRPFDPGTDDARDVRILIAGRGAEVPDRGDLESATGLELFIALGSSVQRFGPERLLERGVTICNTADSVARIVAEHCLMVTLVGLRQLIAADRRMHDGGWRPGTETRKLTPMQRAVGRLRSALRRIPVPISVKARVHRMLTGGAGPGESRVTGSIGEPSELRGQTVGLLGWGAVAEHFARLLAPFECDVLVWSEGAPPEALAAAGARPASLGEILRSAKVISLHRGLTDATRHFLDAAMLDQIPAGRVLVNTARGGLVDEAALVERLRRGDLVAALDVFEEEPLPAEHPLRTAPNVILTPHNASRTAQAEHRMGDEALGYAISWATGDPVPAISADRLARMT